MSKQIETKRFRFYKYFTRNLEEELKNLLEKFPFCFQNISDKLLPQIMKDLIINLDYLMLPTIAAYIEDQKKLGAKDIYKTLFDNKEETTLQILENYSSSTILDLHNRCRQFKNHIVECLYRIQEDSEILKRTFSLPELSKLEEIKFTAGDQHNEGKQTALFYFNNYTKGFVYKPISIKADLLINQVLSYIQQHLPKKYACYDLPKIICRELGNNSYGYIELCKHNSNTTKQIHVEESFYNFGKLIALGILLKITDGHLDNIIVDIPKVYWIDLESAFHTFSVEIKDFHPVEKTGLLFKADPENTVLGIVTGIQGGMIPRLNLTSPISYNDGTDEMYIRYFKVLENYSTKNRIFLNGKQCYPEDYTSNILEGFEDTFQVILENLDNIYNIVKDFLDQNIINTRHLFINTASYNRYIRLFNHIYGKRNDDFLKYYKEERDKTILNSEINFKDFIVENELQDLCNGVIPYFYRKNNSTSIFHISGVFKEGFFDKLLIEDIKEYFDEISRVNISDYKNFITEAIESTRNIHDWDTFKKHFNFPEYQTPNFNKSNLNV